MLLNSSSLKRVCPGMNTVVVLDICFLAVAGTLNCIPTVFPSADEPAITSGARSSIRMSLPPGTFFQFSPSSTFPSSSQNLYSRPFSILKVSFSSSIATLGAAVLCFMVTDTSLPGRSPADVAFPFTGAVLNTSVPPLVTNPSRVFEKVVGLYVFHLVEFFFLHCIVRPLSPVISSAPVAAVYDTLSVFSCLGIFTFTACLFLSPRSEST